MAQKTLKDFFGACRLKRSESDDPDSNLLTEKNDSRTWYKLVNHIHNKTASLVQVKENFENSRTDKPKTGALQLNKNNLIKGMIKSDKLQGDIPNSKELSSFCNCSEESAIKDLFVSGDSWQKVHDHSEGNLMEERCLDVPELNQWLKRSRKYLSCDIQNELIEIMAHNVLREIVKEVKTSPYFGVIADSTTDVHRIEQFSLCLRFVHSGFLEVNEVFVGLYNLMDSRDSSNIILDSSKRRNIYADIVLQPYNDSEEVVLGPYHQLIPLCPTWCVRVKSLKRYKQQYLNFQITLQAILDDPGAIPPEKNATITGYIGKLNTFGSMFYLIVSIEVFCPCEQLARALQNSQITATGAQQAAYLLISRIATLRSDKEFDRLFDEAFVAADRLTLDHLTEPKNRKSPLRLEQMNNTSLTAKLSAKDKFRKEYFEVLDLLSTRLKRDLIKKDSTHLKWFYAEDFEINDVHAQLKLLKNMPSDPPSSCASVVEQLNEVSDTTKNCAPLFEDLSAGHHEAETSNACDATSCPQREN
ncbi:hypothetical protein PR048_012237 [Dryococelus australis]|uniref:DUF4371 domain-containing protein n=1 Tax=Dryococelus australis TaxID=614101 RepID=A0ABQ9HNZ1_9NEOP|nr:hypothetical protein PR048_012237 [Dryococelus australis]